MMIRNHSIDTLRSIATILVILLHTATEYVSTALTHKVFNLSFWIGNIPDSFSRVCVPLFVLISGMFLLGRKDSISSFYRKRISKILFPMIFWTFVYLGYRFFISSLNDTDLSLKSLIMCVVNGVPFYHMWYLFMIIGLYLSTPLINKFIIKTSKNTLWIISVILLLFGMVNGGYFKIFNTSVPFLFWFLNFLGYFLIGYLLNESNKTYSNINLFSNYLISGVLISILTYYTILYWDNMFFYRYLSPLVIIGSISLFKLFLQLDLPPNILSKNAYLTLGVYLIHAGILDFFNYLLKLYNVSALDHSFTGIPIKFSFTLIVSYFIALFFSKIKFLKKLI